MSKNLIYTISSGRVHGIYAQLSVPLMERYAQRCGADFKYDQEDLKYPLFGKFKVGNLLDQYDRVLYLDCDILVRPDSPDLFKIVPEDSFAAFNEGSWCSFDEIKTRVGLIGTAAQMLGIDTREFQMFCHYFNGGVFLANRSHQHLFVLDHDDPRLHEITVEQNFMNLRLYASKTKTYSLPICFNAMSWRWPAEYIAENYFIHYAGLEPGKRFAMMKDDYPKICAFG